MITESGTNRQMNNKYICQAPEMSEKSFLLYMTSVAVTNV